MTQSALSHADVKNTQGDEHSHGGSLLGPLLCWAVVFADIGTSVYYTPGILYQTPGVGKLAGFFVFLTMSVFVLLTLKYAEVTHRFPQGGGVVTVAASAINKWAGALGGMFILVDYFLTASISSLSGMEYLSVVLPSMGAKIEVPLYGPIQLPLLFITIGVLILLGVLNWVGVSESAKVSLIGALIAFVSDIAILITVFAHLSLGQVFALFPQMFANQHITGLTLLAGFAGSFLAFSGLESISQLSPVMKTPRKKVAGMALFLVVITIGITSPFLTMFSTLLLPGVADDPIRNTQIISLLGGKWGGIILQTEVAISASALLVFASNTAIIGSYHVFLALSRLSFFPAFVLQRNKLRDTPHYAIILATGIPIAVLLLVLGNITILGDMYAFGLLGAFSLTCLGLDIVRYRDRRSARALRERKRAFAADNAQRRAAEGEQTNVVAVSTDATASGVAEASGVSATSQNGAYRGRGGVNPRTGKPRSAFSRRMHSLWLELDFWLGVLTTGLVMVAWATNLVNKPLATAFGGTVSLVGMTIAILNYRSEQRRGQATVHVIPLSSIDLLSDYAIAVLLPHQEKHNALVAKAVVKHLGERPIAFIYVGTPKDAPAPRPFEYYEPYLYDEDARQAFRTADDVVQHAKAKVQPAYIYRALPPDSHVQANEVVQSVWRAMHPHELLISADDVDMLKDINPDRIRYELVNGGSVAHLISKW